jgi:2-polyprenyl-6-methoxyphenol hydroxylase-like FAD-dependent oxidoreductase
MDIGILGGGIGGLSAAIALKQAGFDVSVYERHTKLSDIGAGIVCWPNACFVLEQLGTLEDVRKVSGSLQSMNRLTDTGEVIGSLDIKKLNGLMSYPSYSILRQDLMSILEKRANELNIPIFYQHQVTGIKHADSNCNTSVHFQNGLKIEPTVIVGADGRMKSFARQFVNGDNAPIYQGVINWIGIYETSEHNFIHNPLSVMDYWGVGERFGIVPVSNTKAYWAGGVASKYITENNPENYKEELELLFSEWPTPIIDIIKNTQTKHINKIYLHDHNPIQTWHKRNLVLLGDSAHSALPTSGQGACQALEDAWHLALCLQEHTGNLEKAFQQYRSIRFDKTTSITMSGRHLATSIFNNDEAFCQQRNAVNKQMDYDAMAGGMAQLWSEGLPLNE